MFSSKYMTSFVRTAFRLWPCLAPHHPRRAKHGRWEWGCGWGVGTSRANNKATPSAPLLTSSHLSLFSPTRESDNQLREIWTRASQDPKAGCSSAKCDHMDGTIGEQDCAISGQHSPHSRMLWAKVCQPCLDLRRLLLSLAQGR